MGGLVSGLFGSSKKATAPLYAGMNQINQIMDQAREEARRGELINAGGLTTSRAGGRSPLVVTPSPQRLGLIEGVRGSLRQQARGLHDLRAEVRPGFGRLTRSAREVLRAGERRAASDIKGTMARRRLAGSSFAADALSRNTAEFAMRERMAEAEAFVQELGMSVELLNEAAKVEQADFQTLLNELNLQTNLGVELSGKASQSFSTLAGVQANALASLSSDMTSAIGAHQAGQGAFIGRLITMGLGFL